MSKTEKKLRLEGEKVLVTGAAGFIGSHLVEELIVRKADVRALVHYNSRNDYGNLKWINRVLLKKIKIIKGDIRDPFMVRQAVCGCDIVFHLAALIAIPYSYIAPKEFIDTNVHGTLNILEACRISRVKRLIHTSTSEVYGSAKYTPIDELHPLQGQSPYSASKISADKLVESYYCSYGLPVVTIRPFNNYGPRQSQRAIVPTIVSQILSGSKKIHLGNVSTVRDLLYVKDTVQGFILSAVRNGLEGEAINLGFGEGISIHDLALKIAGILNVSIKIAEDRERFRPDKSEVLRLICDNRKARLKLGWEPKIMLKKGLESVIRFISNHPYEYSPEEYVI